MDVAYMYVYAVVKSGRDWLGRSLSFEYLNVDPL